MRGIIQNLEEEQSRTSDRLDAIANAIQEMQRMMARQHSASLQPSIESETAPNIQNPGRVSQPLRGSSAGFTPDPYDRTYKSRITEKIDPLDDGTTPTYRQWRISVRDRLVVNADYYPNEATRKALIWGLTTGLARSYLEPRYATESATAFTNCVEMIELLESFFLTGYESEDARNAFQALQMGSKDHANETFAEFRGRFTSMAVMGEIPASEHFYYLWEKITPALRNAAAPLKLGWNRNLAVAMTALLALDKERRRNYELNSTSTTKTITSTPFVKKTTSTVSVSKPAQKPFVPYKTQASSTPYSSSSRPPYPTHNPVPPRITPVPAPEATGKCYRCGKTGHWANNCPNAPAIKEIDGVDAEVEDQVEDEQPSESYQDLSENDNA